MSDAWGTMTQPRHPGASLDVDLGPVGASLAVRLGHLIDTMQQDRQARNRLLASRVEQPAHVRIAGSIVFSTAAGAVNIIRPNLAGPDQGHVWYIRNLVIGGTDPTVAAAGTADVFVSAGDPRSNNMLGMMDARDRAPSLPDWAFYSQGAIPLRLNEELYVRINGGTNGQTYVLGGTALDFEEGATKQEWLL